MKEEVTLVDGKKAEINVRYLLPRKAYSIVRNVLQISSMNEADGQKELKGDFSGIVELIPNCVDEIVADCPQKEQISISSMKKLYEKYAENTISEVMASVDVDFKKK